MQQLNSRTLDAKDWRPPLSQALLTQICVSRTQEVRFISILFQPMWTGKVCWHWMILKARKPNLSARALMARLRLHQGRRRLNLCFMKQPRARPNGIIQESNSAAGQSRKRRWEGHVRMLWPSFVRPISSRLLLACERLRSNGARVSDGQLFDDFCMMCIQTVFHHSAAAFNRFGQLAVRPHG